MPLADYLAAYPVARAIAELGEAEVSAEFSSALKQLKRLYADLTESQQALVSNYAEIAAAENSMIDIYAADAVTKMISRYRAGLDGLTIEEVRLAYAALTPVQQALVTGTEGLDLTIPAPAESQSPSSCNSSLSVVAAGVTGLVMLAILQRRREK